MPPLISLFIERKESLKSKELIPAFVSLLLLIFVQRNQTENDLVDTIRRNHFMKVKKF